MKWAGQHLELINKRKAAVHEKRPLGLGHDWCRSAAGSRVAALWLAFLKRNGERRTERQKQGRAAVLKGLRARTPAGGRKAGEFLQR